MPDMPKCEVCNERESIGVACVPGVPYSAAYCRECAEAGANPLPILIANTACCGGLDHCSEWWVSMVNMTLTYLNKSREWFNEQVAESIQQLEVYEDANRT